MCIAHRRPGCRGMCHTAKGSGSVRTYRCRDPRQGGPTLPVLQACAQPTLTPALPHPDLPYRRVMGVTLVTLSTGCFSQLLVALCMSALRVERLTEIVGRLWRRWG